MLHEPCTQTQQHVAVRRAAIIARHCRALSSSKESLRANLHVHIASAPQEFDYIIVGGGSAGCVLASRLSEDPQVSVLLLEAGGRGDDERIRVPPSEWASMWRGLETTELDWHLDTESEEHLNGRVITHNRGRCLGGSSGINAMLYVRGDPLTYDSWAKDGCTGWAFKDVLKFFKRSENFLDKGSRDPVLDISHGIGDHGVDGQLTVRTASSLASPGACECARRINDAMFHCGLRLAAEGDYNSGSYTNVVGMTQATVDEEGMRCSSAEGFLYRTGAMQRPNLHVWTGSHVTRVVMDGNAAVAVSYVRGESKASMQGAARYSVAARREVILACGALQSPHLLLLSGIGPPTSLEQHGIPVSVPLPGVGQNLTDHLMLGHGFLVKRELSDSSSPMLQQYFTERVAQAEHPALSVAFFKSGLLDSGDIHHEEVDLQYQVGVGSTVGGQRNIFFSITGLIPKSTGNIELASPDPFVPPSIRQRYLSDEYDLQVMVHAMKFARQIIGAPAMAEICKQELLDKRIPHPPDSDAYLEEYVRRNATTNWHPQSSCRMGPSPAKGDVVDHACKVHGAQRLRVVDASVMRSPMTGNTNAPVIMIAEKVAEMIRMGE